MLKLQDMENIRQEDIYKRKWGNSTTYYDANLYAVEREFDI